MRMSVIFYSEFQIGYLQLQMFGDWDIKWTAMTKFSSGFCSCFRYIRLSNLTLVSTSVKIIDPWNLHGGEAQSTRGLWTVSNAWLSLKHSILGLVILLVATRYLQTVLRLLHQFYRIFLKSCYTAMSILVIVIVTSCSACHTFVVFTLVAFCL